LRALLRRFSGHFRHQAETVDKPPRVPPGTDEDEARPAVEQATARLSEGYHRWPEVRRRAASLTRTYEENHFAERVRNAFGGRP
jgi:hypothetical protein